MGMGCSRLAVTHSRSPEILQPQLGLPRKHSLNHSGTPQPNHTPAPLLPDLLALAPLLPLLPRLPLPALLPLIVPPATAAPPPLLAIIVGRDIHVGGGAAAVAGSRCHGHRIGA